MLRYLYILTCISTRKNGNRERERERELAFSFLVHKIRLGMHDSFLAFQVLFTLFSSGYRIGIYPPQKFSREVYFFSFLYYVFGRIASIWLARTVPLCF